LCPMGAYKQNPMDCAPLGPSEYLTNLAYAGMEYPLQALPFTHPDSNLNDLPYHYYKVNKTGTSFYPTIEAAREKKGASQVIAPGAFFYIVYSQRMDTSKGTYFLLPSGAIMPGDGEDIRTITTPFPGVEVHSDPPAKFGFVFNATAVRSEPNELSVNEPVGLLKPDTNTYPIVQIFDTQNIEGTDWYLIGPDEWILGRDAGVVTTNTNPPPGVTNGRWIDVDLAQQTLAVYDQGKMVFATIIATGAEPMFTRPGLFPIYKKKELETMQGERGTPNYYYLENVPWTMYFDKARALHGAYWRARLGYPQSHGCVNLYPGDAHWLYNWANEGDNVYVHDPSGMTPTDPSFYGDGGA
ncbi:MAG: L,D-transpeptidase, partial [Chloroflexota bacterium]